MTIEFTELTEQCNNETKKHDLLDLQGLLSRSLQPLCYSAEQSKHSITHQSIAI